MRHTKSRCRSEHSDISELVEDADESGQAGSKPRGESVYSFLKIHHISQLRKLELFRNEYITVYWVCRLTGWLMLRFSATEIRGKRKKPSFQAKKLGFPLHFALSFYMDQRDY